MRVAMRGEGAPGVARVVDVQRGVEVSSDCVQEPRMAMKVVALLVGFLGLAAAFKAPVPTRASASAAVARAGERLKPRAAQAPSKRPC